MGNYKRGNFIVSGDFSELAFKASSCKVPKKTLKSIREATKAIIGKLTWSALNAGTIVMCAEQVEALSHDLKMITTPAQIRFMTPASWFDLATNVLVRLDAFVEQAKPATTAQLANPKFRRRIQVPSNGIAMEVSVTQLKAGLETIRKTLPSTGS